MIPHAYEFLVKSSITSDTKLGLRLQVQHILEMGKAGIDAGDLKTRGWLDPGTYGTAKSWEIWEIFGDL